MKTASNRQKVIGVVLLVAGALSGLVVPSPWCFFTGFAGGWLGTGFLLGKY